MIDATPEQVAKIECAIDAAFEALSLPAEEYFQALWHYLTGTEDLPRMVLLHKCEVTTEQGESDDMMKLSLLMDDNKYAVRYLMDLIQRRLPKASRLVKELRTDEIPYTTAGNGIKAAHEYRTAVGLFSLYHSGCLLCSIDETGLRLSFRSPESSAAYLALDYALAAKNSGAELITLFLAWLRSPDSVPPVVRKIGESLKLREKDRVSYSFDPALAKELATKLPQPQSWELVPADWFFPWGGRDEVMALWNSLCVRCAYHLLAINFGAHRLQIVGGAVDDLCLRVQQGELVQSIRSISRVPLNRIVSFVHGMTYGKGARTPDPALQPLIPCGGVELLVPCMHILSSKGGRNLLSLHARLEERSFNGQSAAFEIKMISEVASIIRKAFPFTRTQVNFRIAGEIDLVVIDESSATILIGELRWMIPPGDARETINRIRACREKAVQAEKKVNAVRSDTKLFLRHLRCDASIDKWNILGFVVTENFVMRSPNPNIPIVSKEVLEAGLNNHVNAERLHQWLSSETWLPREKEHFETMCEGTTFGSYTLERIGVGTARPAKYLKSFLPQNAAEFMATP